MDGFPGLGSGPGDIVVRTVVIYAFVVSLLRIGGKREVGQLGTLDLVALLLLANAVQNAMVGSDSSIGGGLIAGVIIIGATRLLDMATRRNATIRRLVIGSSRVLIRNGRVNRRAMDHEQVSDDELQEALHEHGLEYRREVKLATLEVDGSISIVPQPEAAERYEAGSGPDSGSRRAGRVPRRSNRLDRHDGPGLRNGGTDAGSPHTDGDEADPGDPTDQHAGDLDVPVPMRTDSPKQEAQT